MKPRIGTLATLLAVVLCTAAAWAQAPQMASFSADMKMSGPKGQDATGKMFFNSDRHMRMEMNSHGHDVIVLSDATNEANPKSTILMPEQKM